MFLPLNDKVLVERIEEENMTKGGIILAETLREKPNKGIVVSTGPGKMSTEGHRMEMSLKKGDEIFFSKYAGTDININDVEFVIINEEDVMGVLSRRI